MIISCISVTDGMFCMNGTTSVPKSVLRYSVDKVRKGSETEVWYSTTPFVQKLKSPIKVNKSEETRSRPIALDSRQQLKRIDKYYGPLTRSIYSTIWIDQMTIEMYVQQ